MNFNENNSAESWNIFELSEENKSRVAEIFDIISDLINIKIKKVEFNIFDIRDEEEIQNDFWLDINEDKKVFTIQDIQNMSEEKYKNEIEWKYKSWFKVLEFEWDLDKNFIASILKEKEDYLFINWELILFI